MHKGLTSLRSTLTEPPEQANRMLNRKATDYETEQERLARAEQVRLEEQARKREEESRLIDAAELEQAGQAEEAAAVLQAPMPQPVIHVPAQVAKIEGVTRRTTYRAEVTDLMALIRHVAAHPDLVNLLAANTTALNAMARAQRLELRLPGVRAVAEVSRAVRS